MGEQRARDEARESIEKGDFVSGLAERVGSAAGANAVFAEPVERDGVTVIPVARVSWGFGGGGGGSGEDEGHGGGGGASANAQGFIEIEGGQARYRPIRSPLRAGAALLAVLAATAALAALLVPALKN
jgi:uncharacterized spore protein YtfJ